MMPTKLTLEDLEAMRQHYGIAQEEQGPGGERPCDLQDDLGQVGTLEEVGISLQRWAHLRKVYSRTSWKRNSRKFIYKILP